MPEPVSPAGEEWNEWATFANHVTEALHELPRPVLFSKRKAVAEVLWRMGYRPTAEQIEAQIAKQRQQAAMTVRADMLHDLFRPDVEGERP